VKLEDLEALELRIGVCKMCPVTKPSRDCKDCNLYFGIDEIAGLLEWTRQLLEYIGNELPLNWSKSANHCSNCKSGRQCQLYVNTADEQRINCPFWVAMEERV